MLRSRLSRIVPALRKFVMLAMGSTLLISAQGSAQRQDPLPLGESAEVPPLCPRWLQLPELGDHSSSIFGLGDATTEFRGTFVLPQPDSQLLERGREYLRETFSGTFEGEDPDSERCKYLLAHPSLQFPPVPVEDQESSGLVQALGDRLYFRTTTTWSRTGRATCDAVWITPTGVTTVEGRDPDNATEARRVHLFDPRPAREFLKGAAFVADDAIWRAAVLLDLAVEHELPQRIEAEGLGVGVKFEVDLSSRSEGLEVPRHAIDALRARSLEPLNGTMYLPSKVECTLISKEDGSYLWEESWSDAAGGADLMFLRIEGSDRAPTSVHASWYVIGTDFVRYIFDCALFEPGVVEPMTDFLEQSSDQVSDHREVR